MATVLERRRNNASSGAGEWNEMERAARECAGAHTAGACLSWWKGEVMLFCKLREEGVRLATSGEKMLATKVT